MTASAAPVALWRQYPLLEPAQFEEVERTLAGQLGIPDFHRLVQAAGDNRLAVGAERRTADAIVATGSEQKLLAQPDTGRLQ